MGEEVDEEMMVVVWVAKVEVQWQFDEGGEDDEQQLDSFRYGFHHLR